MVFQTIQDFTLTRSGGRHLTESRTKNFSDCKSGGRHQQYHFKRVDIYSNCVRSVSKFYSRQTNTIFVLRPSLNEWTLNLRSTPSHFGGGAMKREMLRHLLQSKFQSYFGGVAMTVKMPLKGCNQSFNIILEAVYENGSASIKAAIQGGTCT